MDSSSMTISFLLLSTSLLLTLKCTGVDTALQLIDSSTTEVVGAGFVNSGEKVLDFLVKFGDTETDKLFSALDKMSGFIGAAGGLLTLVMMFLPSRDSEELEYMKNKFAEVNSKLDQVTQDLDEIKDLIELESQKAAYITAASSILFGFEQMNIFIGEAFKVDCSSQKECLRARLGVAETYVDYFDIKREMYQIMHGSVESVSEFGEPLLDLIKSTFKCNVGKIDQFSNGVLKLAMKGQQVTMIHEILTGYNSSLLVSLNSWTEMVYTLRRRTNEVKDDCYTNIATYMAEDIQDKEYQTGYGTNEAAALAAKQYMDLKYPWVHWVLYAFSSREGDDVYSTTETMGGDFVNKPYGDNKIRTIVATPQDKGLYTSQSTHFQDLLDDVLKDDDEVKEIINGYDNAGTHCYIGSCKITDTSKIYNRLKWKSALYPAWNSLVSITLLNDVDNEDDLQFATNENLGLRLFNENEEFRIGTWDLNHNQYELRINAWVKVRVLAVFKSLEQITDNECDRECNQHGECKMLPFSSETYCECEDYYQGENCEDKLEVELALTMESLLAITFKVPKLTDIFFEIKDVGIYLGAAIDKVLDATTKLGNLIKNAAHVLDERLTEEFRWAKLATAYTQTITDITYYTETFPILECQYAGAGSSDAVDSMIKDILRWIHDINFLFVGRKEIVVNHESVLLMMMKKHEDRACTPEYKDAIDIAWKQLILLQSQAYMLLARARDACGESSDVTTEYQATLDRQTQYLSGVACELDIPYSSNVHCTGTWYLFPGMDIQNTCQSNYFISGSTTANCLDNQSECSLCDCDENGSVGKECSDLVGVCQCKDRYYGTKCENFARDCQWGLWTVWSDCPTCGSGTKTRTRSIAVTSLGSGAECTGADTETQACSVSNCCSGTFKCDDACMSNAKQCDYIDDCRGMDERGCSERDECWTTVNPYTKESGGDARGLALQNKIGLGIIKGYTTFLQMFELQTDHYKLRYTFRDCALKVDLCPNNHIWKSTPYYNDHGGDMREMVHHNMDCGFYGFLGFIRMEKRTGEYQFTYTCCAVPASSVYRNMIGCVAYKTPEDDDGAGHVKWLDRHKVECPADSYLSQVQLKRSRDQTKIYYAYRCCHIT